MALMGKRHDWGYTTLCLAMVLSFSGSALANNAFYDLDEDFCVYLPDFAEVSGNWLSCESPGCVPYDTSDLNGLPLDWMQCQSPMTISIPSGANTPTIVVPANTGPPLISQLVSCRNTSIR